MGAAGQPRWTRLHPTVGFPGGIIPIHWKLTTTLQGPTWLMPLEI